jgi:hypothetical protein
MGESGGAKVAEQQDGKSAAVPFGGGSEGDSPAPAILKTVAYGACSARCIMCSSLMIDLPMSE